MAQPKSDNGPSASEPYAADAPLINNGPEGKNDLTAARLTNPPDTPGEFILLLDSSGTIQSVSWFADLAKSAPGPSLLGRKLSEARREGRLFSRAHALLEQVREQTGSETAREEVFFPETGRHFEIRIAPVLRGPFSEQSVPPENRISRDERLYCLRVSETTNLHRARQKTEILETILREAEKNGHLGSWEYDCDTSRFHPSRELRTFFGVPEGAEWREEIFWSTMNQAEVQSVAAIINHGVAECKPYEFISHHRALDGRERILFTTGMPIPDETGRTRRVVGVSKDISDPTRADESLRQLSNANCTKPQGRLWPL